MAITFDQDTLGQNSQSSEVTGHCLLDTEYGKWGMLLSSRECLLISSNDRGA